jgi:hypothetical protein
MKNDITRLPATAILLAALCLISPVLAHHSVAAEFDQSKPITFTGTIQKVAWMNPHIYTHIQVKTATGETVVYRVEGGPPNSLFRQGWRKDTLKIGEVVTVTGMRAKNPDSLNIGMATMTTADGRKIFSGAGPAKSP